ncbi:MAG: hypothetical protein E7057_07555 [Lentisphaerae bacterium]|nr:hypothetical protein [Lentisphaerota bacterium]
MIKVAQCWDDGVLNDVKLADLCRKYNAKATFNLNPALHRAKERITTGWQFRDTGYYPGKLAWNEIKDVYDGFEVASHTMCHCNAGEVDDQVFLTEAVSAKVILEDLFQKPCRGFAWPCGRYTDKTADLLQAAGFAYGRTVQNTDTVSAFKHPMILHSSCHFQNPEFWNIFETAKTTDNIFYFWGHSYEMMDDENLWAAFEDKLRRLSSDPEVQWVNVIDLAE